MLIFNCTQAATDFFTTVRNGKMTSPMSPTPPVTLTQEPALHDHQHWHWMIHTKKINRKNVLLTIDTDSRFCMLFWGLKKGDVQSFLEQFHERLTLHLTALVSLGKQRQAVLETGLQTFLKNHHEYAFTQRNDRSVQAHINEVFMYLGYEQERWEDDIPTEEDLFLSDLRHNDTLRKRRQDKDYIYPYQEFFRAWLSGYANLEQASIGLILSRYQQESKRLRQHPFFDIHIDENGRLHEFIG